MAALQLHVQAKTAVLQDCMEHYGSMPHRKLAKKVYSRRQATLVAAAKVITAGCKKEKVLVGYGDSSIGHNSCISRPHHGPNKKLIHTLKQYALVVLVDEYRTSKIFSTARPASGCCDGRLKRFWFKRNEEIQRPVYAITAS